MWGDLTAPREVSRGLARYHRCFAKGLGSEDPERPTADPRCRRLLTVCGAFRRPGEKFVFSVHAWILAAPPLHDAISWRKEYGNRIRAPFVLIF